MPRDERFSVEDETRGIAQLSQALILSLIATLTSNGVLSKQAANNVIAITLMSLEHEQEIDPDDASLKAARAILETMGNAFGDA